MDNTIHVAIPAVGEAYKFYAEVTAYSIRKYASQPVEIHYIGEEDFKHVTDVSRFSDYHGSNITWSRLWLPELFPDFDWILSCDADILFLGDVAELWKLRDDKYWAQPSRDNPLPGIPYNKASVGWLAEKGMVLEHPEEYFCAGLTLFNLKAMREGGWAKMRDEFLPKYGIDGLCDADQCSLNWLLRDRKQRLPRGWGVFSGDENADIDWTKPCAVHFVEDTPWKRYKITHLASDLVEEWWKVAQEVSSVLPVAQGYRPSSYKGCRNILDYAWRRAGFVFLKHNQWILRLNHKLWLHLRSTRGVRR